MQSVSEAVVGIGPRKGLYCQMLNRVSSLIMILDELVNNLLDVLLDRGLYDAAS